MRVTVLIRPKAGILDPQGEAVQASLSTLGFAVNPVLEAAEVPLPRLGEAGAKAPRLGWNTWLPRTPRDGEVRPRTAPEAVFGAETIIRGREAVRGPA